MFKPLSYSEPMIDNEPIYKPAIQQTYYSSLFSLLELKSDMQENLMLYDWKPLFPENNINGRVFLPEMSLLLEQARSLSPMFL